MLIVDDEELVRMVGCDILEFGGYRVIEAADAGAALQCLEAQAEVMVLFTDINMPGTPDGLGLAQLVHDRWPHVKILVASGNVRPGPGDMPPKGVFLSKPYRADDLLTLVRTLTQAED
ncbi:response regulator [Caulobacter sp. S45]|uniref:response regulator n=1 Tax=Caulobacter sp. S45 TaxID=1641861 RepID=UPI001C209A21|nr:response regulator [Caulobacter sp. S45]